MSEGALWLIYASGAVPAFALRRYAASRMWFCCIAAGIWALLLWLVFTLPAGIDLSEKWSAVGLWVAFWLGLFFGLAGAGIAIWRE